MLHQQPCYCYCDRMGHNSLHSCFENTHGAQCATCLKELYYSYQQHKKGKTAAQIRGWHHQGRVEADRSAVGLDDELTSDELRVPDDYRVLLARATRYRLLGLLAREWTSTRSLSDTLLLG